MAGDNATAETFALRARAERVAWGEVEERGVRLAKGVAGVGDEIVTLKNDRRLMQAPGEFVRNGERWRVLGRHGDGSLAVEELSGRGQVTLPATYVREHVALAYALTVHKAQGQTVDVGIALVDERMTSQQLYVAMSRGRDENRAFVIQSQGELSEHAFANFTKPTLHEVLAEVMRRDGAERSAHDVLRQNLEKMDDLDLLRHLHAEANKRIDEQAGRDRTEEIAPLADKADLGKAQAGLEAAYEHLRELTRRRELAEQRIGESAARPVRADAELRAVRVEEQRALREAERARHALYAAERATDEVDRLREAQQQRVVWLRSHLDEERYLVQLEARIAEVDGAIGHADEEQNQGRRHAEPPRLSTAEQAIVDRSPRRRFEHKLVAEEERLEPREWRTVAELERRSAQIEKELTATTAQIDRDSARADDATRAGETADNRQTIAHVRDEAARHRSAAAASRDQGERLIGQARADYFAARDAAAVIDAGPGRLHFRAGAVADARARLDEIEARWPGRRLPDTFWSDQMIRDAAEKAAHASVEPEVRGHLAAVKQSEQEARRIEQQMAQRERIYEMKERRVAASVVERARAESARAELAKDWRQREKLAKDMTPEEIAEADYSRDAWLDQLAVERHEFLVRDQVRGIEHAVAPHLELHGPEIDFGR